VLGLWGAVLGYLTGSAVYLALYQWLDGSVIGVIPIQVFAIAFALLAAWLSFAFYAIGVLLSMGSVGWGLGLMLAEATSAPGWLSFALGMVVAAGLVMVGWAMNLPKLLLVVLTAMVGAGAVVNGVLLLLNQQVLWFDNQAWQAQTGANLAWTAAYIALAASGMVVQMRAHSEGTLREAYKGT